MPPRASPGAGRASASGARRAPASPRQAAIIALLRTAALVERYLARVVQAEGLSFAQYNALRILRGAGADGLPTMAIRERLLVPAPGITRLIDRLEQAGYVRRTRTAGDRREVRCLLTAAGRALLARLDEPVDAADEQVLGALSLSESRELVGLLDRARAALGAADPGVG
ncbi:MAG TPA: MarR family transcriptional regulator [Gemmatimonadales bacterium]|jgi:DNA-binding MarR family transcriptional regulator|nr:MarR family transcriptional regulator [Gemmatimonadales bacterium]